MGDALPTARQSVRLQGGLALLIGGVLLLISLFVPWVVGGTDRNAFGYLPAVALLWLIVAVWSVGAAVSRARVDAARGLVALAVLASVALISDVVVLFSGASAPVIGPIGGGPSLALVGLLAIFVGIWQADDAAPVSDESPEG